MSCTAKPMPAASTLRACVLRLCASGARRLQFKVMTNTVRWEIALRAGAGLFVLMVGYGAAFGGMEQSSPTPGASATSAIPSEIPLPPPAPGGPTGGGGALPVVPVGGGGCIPGLNCGCIGRNCPPFPQPHHSAPANGQPNNAPAAPRPGGG